MTASASRLRPLRDTNVCGVPQPGAMDVRDARDLILASVHPIADTVEATLERMIGCVAVADVRSPSALPRFDKSAMDGCAIHAVDLGSTRPLLARYVSPESSTEAFVTPVARASSSALAALCEADGFVEIAAATGDVAAGQDIVFHPFEFSSL